MDKNITGQAIKHFNVYRGINTKNEFFYYWECQFTTHYSYIYDETIGNKFSDQCSQCFNLQ